MNTATTWLLSVAFAISMGASYHLDRTTPDDVTTAALVAERVAELGSDLQFAGTKP